MGAILSWTNIAIAAVALVLVLIAFRVIGRIRLTFRFRGAVTVSPWAQQPCPHLGLLEEPFIHRDDPTEDHRCYLWMQRDRIDLTHQKGFCLSSAHAQCPWMSIAPPAGQEPVSRKLATATPVKLGSIWDRLLDESTSFLVWLVWKLNRGRIVARQWADRNVPLLVPLARFVGREVSARAPVVGRAIANASGIAAYALLAWLRRRSSHFGGPAKDSTNEAWKARAGATPGAASPAEMIESVDIAASELSSSFEQSTRAPEPAAPVFMIAPAKGNMSHLENLIEHGKTAGMSGNRKLAYSLFSLAVDLDPKNDDAWLWKGGMTDDTEEKLACLQQALAINPNNQKAQQAFRQISQSFQRKDWAAQSDAQGAASARGHGLAGLAGERGRVPGLAAGALASEEALTSAALMALEHGDEAGAHGLFIKATELSPGSEKAWFWRAKTSATLSDVIYSLQQALVINPGNEKVRANLLWAIQRQQREEEAAEAERKAAKEEIKGKKEEAKSRRRSPVAWSFRWLATLACLALAACWLLVALLPLFELTSLRQAVVEVQGMTEIDMTDARLLYESVRGLLPGLSWASVPWNEQLEVTEDYNLLAAIPYIVGFLFLFVAMGLAQRERWSRFWALAATIISFALLAFCSTGGSGASLMGVLGIATILTLVLSRSEFKRETTEVMLQQERYAKMAMPASQARGSTY